MMIVVLLELLTMKSGKACKQYTKKYKIIYRKIPKISPGAYIFQRPFLRGLYSEGLIYERKSIGLAL